MYRVVIAEIAKKKEVQRSICNKKNYMNKFPYVIDNRRKDSKKSSNEAFLYRNTGFHTYSLSWSPFRVKRKKQTKELNFSSITKERKNQKQQCA